jgi:hypothetical protein
MGTDVAHERTKQDDRERRRVAGSPGVAVIDSATSPGNHIARSNDSSVASAQELRRARPCHRGKAG